MKNFEEKLNRLQTISDAIKQNDISLEDALKYFEEGIALSRGMEKELSKIEDKIQILMNQPISPEEKPELSLFSEIE